MSIICPTCGASGQDDFRYCPYCATVLAAALAEPEERKVVTALFCDLVGFTSLSERHDHEEVDAFLSAYSTLARKAVSDFEGTVEKYIGDAVAAVFGFPKAHDDDPLRAVRAGMRLVEGVAGLPPLGDDVVSVRVGVNTGEVYARLGVDPATGQTFVTGDVINTAARLQTVAPPMGVAVGELTHRLTARSVEYEELPPADLKGKAAAVRVWRVVRAVAAEEFLRREVRAPLVGRGAELTALRGLLERCGTEGRSAAAVVVGEPGIGKSRLLTELAAEAASDGGIFRWLQGGCHPYGAVAFSALAEVIARCAGVGRDVAPDRVERRLAAAVPAGADHLWMLQHLRPLLGLPAPQAAREDRFAAWTAFLEHAAREAPTVVVFEDLHWADGELLAFVDHLIGLRLAAPLAVIVSGRPELLELAPELFAAPSRPLVVALGPLRRDEAARLAGDLVGQVLSDDLAELVRERTGDNPLFVLEYVGLLQEQGVLRRGVAGVELRVDPAELTPPASLQGVIGARLDLLEAPVKAVLSDAAVLGETFWSEGVAAVGGHDDLAVDEAVRELLARGLVRIADDALDGAGGLTFSHALTRDVAYARVPKRLRLAKHAAAALWLEGVPSGQAYSAVVALAHHYAAAYELAEELGDGAEAARLRGPAVDALSLAGRQAEALVDGGAAERQYARALGVVAPDDPHRFLLMAKRAGILTGRNRAREAVLDFETAIPGLVEAHDLEAAVIASLRLSDALTVLGDARFRRAAEDAGELAGGLGPSAVAVEALCVQASIAHEDHGPSRALEVLDRAAEVASGFGGGIPVWARGVRGRARCALGDAGGLDDIREAVRLAEAQGHRGEQALLVYELAWSLVPFEGPAAALDALRTCTELWRRAHMEGLVNAARSIAVRSLYWTGQWDAALDACEDLAPEMEAAEDAWGLAIVRYVWSLVLLGRGDWGRADPLAEQALLAARDNPIRGVSAVYLVASAVARRGVGDACGCVTLLEECQEVLRDKGETLFVYLLPMAVRTALAVGREDLARRLAAGVVPASPFAARIERTLAAQLLELDGEPAAAATAYERAARDWRGFSMPFEEAHAWLAAGRCLAELGEAGRAADALRRAAALFEGLGAAPALGEVNDIMRRST